MSVDKKIHYCWFGGKELPDVAVKCINSWKEFMPDYTIVEWNESNFDINSNRYVKEAYDSKKYAFVSDYARLKIVYDNGGVYFDTDVELLKPLSEEMMKNGFFAKEGKKYINTGVGFAAKKGDKTVKKMLDSYNNIPFLKEDGSFDELPCPKRNTMSVKDDITGKCGNEYIDGKPIYPKEFFSPRDYKTNIIKITKNTYAIHHGQASWFDKKTRRKFNEKYKYIRKFGKTLGTLIYHIDSKIVRRKWYNLKDE